MLKELKAQIFGLDSYEKVKIDDRIQAVSLQLSGLKIQNLEDFETLEECIYKIKDLLRIKSSNLNRIIKDPTKKLTKKDILNLIEKLITIKIQFLKTAFAALETNKIKETEMSEKPQEAPEEQQEQQNQQEFEKPITNENPTQIFETENFKLYLQKGKTPYLLFNFKNEIQYNILRNFSVLIFEEMEADATNIIVEGKRAMIIPRKTNDNLLQLPKINSDLDQIFQILQKAQNSNETPQTNQNDADYIEIDKIKDEFHEKNPHRKQDDNSLDSLLMGQEEKKFTPSPHPKQDKDKPEILPDDKIEIEKKDPEPLQKVPEIQIEKKEPKPESKPQPQNSTPNTELKSKPQNPHTFYQDEEITAYIKKDSSIPGEIILIHNSQKPLSQLSENELSYIFLFSKAFSAALFEILQAHGTNIFWNYNKNTIHITPRYQNDNLKINWEGGQASEDFLEQIKSKLIEEMQKEITQENKKPEEATKTETDRIQDKIDKSKKEKLSQLIEHLERIP